MRRIVTCFQRDKYLQTLILTLAWTHHAGQKNAVQPAVSWVEYWFESRRK